jgi:4-amino-4-deoxy-L-arabinose transferase-like glycosyltransferase
MQPPRKGIFASLTATPAHQLTLLLIALGVLVYLPFAGNYGMWDPWETHYGEVARQMLERNDFVSQWWPGSPQDRAEFWSKPVLSFWLMAISMKVFGLEWHGSTPADQMASSWRPEWACRLPFILLGIAGVWATYVLARRVVGKRVGIVAGVVLLTSSQWALIARQAMTDMPFVVPMTLALALAGLALLLPAEEVEAELPRHRLGRFTIPDDPAYRGMMWLGVLTIVPQLIVMSVQLQPILIPLRIPFLHLQWTLRLLGFVPMLPYWAAYAGALVWCSRATNKRQMYLFSAYILCGLSCLAKGPAGMAIPAIIMIVYLILSGRIREIITHLEIPRGVLLFIATTFPWYHAMLIRHGAGFWNEFIGDNYVRRAEGRHGDRGTFEYYVEYIGYGMFPWTGFVAVGTLNAFRWLGERSPRARLAAYAIVWALVDWTLVTLVNTKFHHYILPALPALAILTSLAIDELMEKPSRFLVIAMLVIGVPLTFVAGHDLAAFPARILWMFNYDYVNMPGTGRPWPVVSTYGDRYEYGNQIFAVVALATLATLAFVLSAARRKTEPPTPPIEDTDANAGMPRHLWLVLGGALVLTAIAIAFGPASPNGAAPTVPRWLWLAPTVCMLPLMLVVMRAGLSGLGGASRRWLVALALLATVWTGFLVDKLYIELSPHWAQKHVIAAYYANRKSPDEKLIAWQLYWRGENFYTRNEIYRSANADERTVFLGDRNVEKMQKWFAAHKGKRVFFVVERVRFESLRGTLPEASRKSLTIVDQSNNKLYLGVAQL